ncbi:MAG: hypothetical protein K8R48_08805 [Alphaproteobacteria bacterium]|nr:hypothetical protein [Alphaproteobacteria bacterium]
MKNEQKNSERQNDSRSVHIIYFMTFLPENLRPFRIYEKDSATIKAESQNSAFIVLKSATG